VFDFAKNGKLPDVKECIMNGANVDEYKDSVREKKKKINVRHTHDPLERGSNGLRVRKREFRMS